MKVAPVVVPVKVDSVVVLVKVGPVVAKATGAPVSVPAGAKATDVLTPVQMAARAIGAPARVPMATVARLARVTPVRHAVKATAATISSCQ